MNGKGIATSLVAMVIVAIAVAVVGAYFLVTQMGGEKSGWAEGEGENQAPPENWAEGEGENQAPPENWAEGEGENQAPPENCCVPGDILLTISGENLMMEVPFIGEISLGHRDHAGIYVGDGEVVEAAVSGVHKSPLSSWEGREGQVGVEILRVDVSDEIRAEAVKFAEAQLGESYDWNWMSKNYENSENEWYCSEIVWAAYKNQGIDLDANTLGFGFGGVAPQEIYDSSYTHVIASELLPECDQE